MTAAAPALPTETPREIDSAHIAKVFTTYAAPSSYSWSLDTVRSARLALMAGDFTTAAALHDAMKTDPAIYAGMLNRIAPHRALPREVRADRTRIRKEAAETFGRDAAALEPTVVADTFERVAGLGLWVGQNRWTAREDGGRIDVRLEPWPMRAVKWDSHKGKLMAITTEGRQEIVHGDGKWVIATLHAEEPWQWAADKALAIPWVSRATGQVQRDMHAETHGLGKIIGQLPQGVAINDAEGVAFATALQNLRRFRSGGVFPKGSEIQLLESMSQGWQIFRELFKATDSDIASVLLGTNASTQTEGGNYVKDRHLFGVRNDIVEGDLGAVARAYNSGVLLPWALLNFGDASYAPELRWLFPDADEAARIVMLSEHHIAYNDVLSAYAANGFEVTPDYARQLAEQFGVTPPELKEPVDPPAPPPAPEPEPADDEPEEPTEEPPADESE